MAKMMKKKAIIAIATIAGMYGGMRIYLEQRRLLMEKREKEREKQWSLLDLN